MTSDENSPSEETENADDYLSEASENAPATSGYDTLSNGSLSPRHRQLAILAAQGWSNERIAKELQYGEPTVSTLLRNPYIKAEIARLQDKQFEQGVSKRIKDFAEPALNLIEECLTDRLNKFKKKDRLDVAMWVVEKLDGKATQKIDLGENMIGVLMDRLDALKSSGVREVVPYYRTPSPPTIDVTSLTEPRELTEEEIIDVFVDDEERQT